MAVHNFSKLSWGCGGGECFPHRNRASVIEHILFKYKVDLSEGDSGQQW